MRVGALREQRVLPRRPRELPLPLLARCVCVCVRVHACLRARACVRVLAPPWGRVGGQEVCAGLLCPPDVSVTAAFLSVTSAGICKIGLIAAAAPSIVARRVEVKCP